MEPDLHRRAVNVRLLLLDVDGVLTDGRLYFANDEIELKAFDIQDGLGMRMLQQSGVDIAIISGRTSRALELRAANLRVQYLFQGVDDKRAAFEQLLLQLKLPPSAVAAMGDDLPDLPILRRCGLAVCVPDAPALVRSHAHYITEHRGGRGAVRETCELLMAAQGTLEAQVQEFLK